MLRIRLLPLAFVVLAGPALGGVNSGFVVSIDGSGRVDNPVIGEQVQVAVRAAGTVEIKGIRLVLTYDPEIVEFLRFTAGDITPGTSLPEPTVALPGGRQQITGGSTILGAGITQPTTGGLLGTFAFQVVGELPDAGSAIWLRFAEVNTSAADEDADVLSFDDGQLGVRLVRRFANRIFNLDVKRRDDGAILSWESRFPGLDDTLRVRATGTGEWTVFVNPGAGTFDADLRLAESLLLAAGIDVSAGRTEAFDAVLSGAGLGPPYAGDFLERLNQLHRLVRTRRHLITADGLSPDTQYEYQARSTSLRGQVSNRLEGLFRTRSAPDLRPATGVDLDVQATRTTASLSWFTNRPADTQVVVSDVDTGTEIASVQLDPEGTLVHAATVRGLEPGRIYAFTVISRLTDVDDLLEQGLLSEDEVEVVKTGTFRTALERRPLRLLGPPARIVAAESAVINFRLNQIGLATVAYGRVDAGADAGADGLYEHSISSGDILNTHSVTLSDLVPSTAYRFRLTVVTPDGDSLSTDPRGNFQWSRDHRVRTSAEGDTLPPVVIEGPEVIARDQIAVIRLVTDVDTRATVFFGTRGGTYGTADEFEIPDQTPDGSLRLSQEHAVTVGGLEPGRAYDYGIVVEATNGQTASFEPNLPAGKPARAAKRLKLLQPPGGAGSFTTANLPDTQFPVILAGPTVSSRTHRTAIIEWTTDEPATSQVQFGVEVLGEGNESSGINETRHRMVLSNLAAGTRYAYQVGSVDASGNGATLSALSVFTTEPELDLTAPEITAAPVVIYKNDEVATIRFTTDEDATAQVVFGTDRNRLDFIRTLPSTAKVHEITLTNLQAATTYHFRTASEDLSGNGPTRSDTLSFTTDAAADVTAPVVADVVVEAADSSAIIAWSSDELADSFVDFGVVSGLLDVTVGDAEDVTDHRLTLTNLEPDTEYFFTVGSIDRAGNGPTRSAEISFRTVTGGDLSAPKVPAGVTGSAGNRQVQLSWQAGDELDLAGYNVYRRTSPADTFAVIATRLTETGYTDRAVDNDVEYAYQVTAIDRVIPPNESAPAATVSFTPARSAAPTVPTALTVGGEPLQPTFSFANAEPFRAGAVLTYTVQVSTRTDFDDVTASASGLAAGAGGTTAWTIGRTLDDGRRYYWRVRAREGTLVGPFTEAAQFLARSPSLLPGDFDDSGLVDLDDFFLFIDAFGQPAADFPQFDLDASGAGTPIGLDDFFVFVDLFGTSLGKPAAPALWAQADDVDETARLRLELTGGPIGSRADGTDRGRVRVRVFAEDVQALAAYGFVLTWDPAALRLDRAEEGAGHLLESRGGATGLFRILDRRPGRALVANGLLDGDPVSGSGLLAELTFHLHDGGPRAPSDLRFEIPQAFVTAGGGHVRRVAELDAASLLPRAFALAAAYPNPFNPSTRIDFALAVDTPARLDVYDVLGRRVRSLVRSESALGAGFYSAVWDGRDGRGRPVASGVYFYRLDTPVFARTGRMLLLK